MIMFLLGYIFGCKLFLSEVENFKLFFKYMVYLDFDNGIECVKMILS